MITILVAEDHQVVRQGICSLLSAEEDLRVIGQAGDGLEAIRLVERLSPQILLLDLMMPGINGLEVARQVGKDRPFTKMIILSMHADESYVLQSLRAGASGYLLKESSSEELVFAIHEVIQGRLYLSHELSQNAIQASLQEVENVPPDIFDTLTSREREVLQLAAQGLSNTQIGEMLSISPRTVETHRANLMRKLKLQNYSQLIKYALHKGVIQ
jgi:RNA polymerase sigma factor (sigma-70 family)